MRVWPVIVAALLSPLPIATQAVARPIVGELFTSEACSSCPPADAEVATLARTRPDLLLLTFHVTYWNHLGWHDPFSLDAATQRQERYVALGISPEVYTPALVVEGRLDAVGSDTEAVENALRKAAASSRTDAALDVRPDGSGVAVAIGDGAGRGTVVIVGYDRLHRTNVGRGENTGRTLLEANIVRSLAVIGSWSGHSIRWHVPRPAGQEVAVLLQAADGQIVGAGRLEGG